MREDGRVRVGWGKGGWGVGGVVGRWLRVCYIVLASSRKP